MAIFTGAATALITPFTEDLKVNYNKLEELVDYQIDNGIDALVICGTTGEASTLSEDEHLECIRVATKRANKRVPIIAGTGSNCTETAKYLSREACKAGADALLVVTPYYNKATQRGLFEHYSEIASAVDAPIVLYNVPGRTGCNITGDTILKILQNVDNVVGIKEASGNITQVAEIMKRVDCNIDLYSGNDDQVLPVLSLGGKGVISVMSNLLPKEMHDLVYRFLEGDPRGSLDIQLKYFDVMKSLFCEVNPIPVKAAMNLMGFDVGSLRRPLTYMEPENIEKLKRDMKTVGLI